jgi:RHS repeat-associated protein
LTEFLYSGEQFDSKIGQQYLRARYYDPATGRFNRLDPFFGNLFDPQSLHNYLYCHADPITFTDPSGEFVTILLTAMAIGAFFGTIYGIESANSNPLIRTNLEYFQHVVGYTILGASGAGAGVGLAVAAVYFTIPFLVVAAGGYVLGALLFDVLYVYNHFSTTANEDVLGLILLSRWAVGTCPIFAPTNWIQYGLGFSTFNCNNINHMSSTVFGYEKIQNKMDIIRNRIGTAKGSKDNINDIALNPGDGSTLQWILNEVNLKAEVIDDNGTIRWTIEDTVDSKSFDDAMKNGHLAKSHDAGTNGIVIFEVLAGIYGDLAMRSSYKFEVTYDEYKW